MTNKRTYISPWKGVRIMVHIFRRLRWFTLPGLLALLLVSFATSGRAGDPDPAGTKTGATIDIPAAKPGQPTPLEITDAIGHNRVSINFMWTLITGFLVMFMQAGFALVETG